MPLHVPTWRREKSVLHLFEGRAEAPRACVIATACAVAITAECGLKRIERVGCGARQCDIAPKQRGVDSAKRLTERCRRPARVERNPEGREELGFANRARESR